MDAWPRIVVHADMDAFYAAVEQLDNPSLRGKPILVGPNSYRGVVLTASYEARKYRVGSAMPVAEARRRCPQAIMVEPRFERYVEISRQVMDIFGDFSPKVEALSLDEAFLEMTGAAHIFGSPIEMGRKIKQAVKSATGLDVSVGISGTKYVAKVASAHEKPDGLTVVPQALAPAWLAPLPVTRLWGVGRKTAPRLLDLGLATIGDVARADPAFLVRHLGGSGRHFFDLANAQDPRDVQRGRASKSIGSDRTLSRDISDPEEILRHLRRSAERIARRVREKGYVARGV
ncbi:MAG: DNA polymerase IV, partial [Pseudomonadales bacterium]|nr:DNA polymerase IV [Pseudomonadales bacterium]